MLVPYDEYMMLVKSSEKLTGKDSGKADLKDLKDRENMVSQTNRNYSGKTIDETKEELVKESDADHDLKVQGITQKQPQLEDNPQEVNLLADDKSRAHSHLESQDTKKFVDNHIEDPKMHIQHFINSNEHKNIVNQNATNGRLGDTKEEGLRNNDVNEGKEKIVSI